MNGPESTAWIKATASNSGNNCVEMRRNASGQVEVRNSKRPDAGTLKFTPEEWAAWLDGAKNSEFDHLA